MARNFNKKKQMGITAKSLDRINQHIKPGSKILLIGCQNLYNSENYGQIAHEYFKGLGHDVKSVDILGCQGSDVADLREDLNFEAIFDMVNDCGSKEHMDCETLYIPFKNMHDACKLDGVMIHENPKTGNWPGHGQHYFTLGFYGELAKVCDYELLECREEPAMGNDVDGWNVCAVMKKLNDEPFISKTKFNNIYKKHIHGK